MKKDKKQEENPGFVVVWDYLQEAQNLQNRIMKSISSGAWALNNSILNTIKDEDLKKLLSLTATKPGIDEEKPVSLLQNTLEHALSLFQKGQPNNSCELLLERKAVENLGFSLKAGEISVFSQRLQSINGLTNGFIKCFAVDSDSYSAVDLVKVTMYCDPTKNWESK